MARNNFLTCFGFTLGHEGGLSMDRQDPGNWTGGKVGKGELKGTNLGISAAAYPAEDIKGMTQVRAQALYKRDYWDKVRGDLLPAGFDLAAWDYAVNSGPARAVKDMQRVLGVRVDGSVGAATMEAAAKAGVKGIKALCARRLSFMRSLSTWARYKGGWSRRVAEVEAKSVAMFLAASGLPKSAQRAAIRTEAATAEKKSAVNNKASASAGAIGGIGGVTSSVGGAGTTLSLVVCLVVTLAVMAILAHMARRHKERAKAYADITPA